MLSGDLPRSLEALASVRALILNEREGCALTGTDDPEEAARRLAAFGTTVVVTCSQAGAVAVDTDGVVYRAGAPSVDVDDPTGAGDLFIAAYVWADLDRRRFEDRLALATRYASLSLEAATRKQKGLSREEFERALDDAALARPLKEEA
jgi:sugar/nucleoside kinase (ribokinase family)